LKAWNRNQPKWKPNQRGLLRFLTPDFLGLLPRTLLRCKTQPYPMRRFPAKRLKVSSLRLRSSKLSCPQFSRDHRKAISLCRPRPARCRRQPMACHLAMVLHQGNQTEITRRNAPCRTECDEWSPFGLRMKGIIPLSSRKKIAWRSS
jgi:hypothetical protein